MDLMYIHILQCFRTCGAESTTSFCCEEQNGWMTLLMILGCHSWLGPGILYLDLHCVLADIVSSLG